MAAHGLLLFIISAWVTLWYLTRKDESVPTSRPVVNVQVPQINTPPVTVATAHGVGLPTIGNAPPVSVTSGLPTDRQMTLVPTAPPVPEHGIIVTDPTTGDQVIRQMTL